MKFKRLLTAGVLAGSITFLGACGGAMEAYEATRVVPTQPPAGEVVQGPLPQPTSEELSNLGAARTGEDAELSVVSLDLAEALEGDPSFTVFTDALAATGLLETLAGSGPYTIFAPTDAAFSALPAAEFDQLQNNPEQLRNLLAYHIVDGQALQPAEIEQREILPSLTGQPVQVTVDQDAILVGENTALDRNGIATTNGVVYRIGEVLQPPEE